MSAVVRDVGEVQFEQVRSVGGGGVVVMPPGAHLMDDDPGVDPAVQAAADVKWLLSQASGLQRLVDLGDQVRGEEDPNELPHDPDAPQRVSPPHEANSIDTTVTEPGEPPS
jgi:hypothetical protein